MRASMVGNVDGVHANEKTKEEGDACLCIFVAEWTVCG